MSEEVIKMNEDKLINAFKRSLNALNDKYLEYHDEKEKQFKPYNGRSNKSHVYLGRSPSASSFFEERFATNISEAFKEYDFYVDHPLTFENDDDNNTTIYPDIMVLTKPSKESKNLVLRAIIELKIDIGHLKMDDESKTKRKNREKMFKKSKAEFNLITGDYGKDKNKNNERISVEIKKNLKKILVVATRENQHSVVDKNGTKIPKSGVYKNEMEKDYGYITIFLLDEKTHPTHRDIKNKINEAIKKNKDDIINAFKGV